MLKLSDVGLSQQAANDAFSAFLNTAEFDSRQMHMEVEKLENPQGIIVFGASGSGCTALGRELAKLMNFEHFDTDDYSFERTNPLFTHERPLNKRIGLLQSLIKSNFVITGCIREWAGAFNSMLSMAVFVITPTNVRIERLETRAYNRYSERIKQGGDSQERHKKFIEYVSKLKSSYSVLSKCCIFC